MNHDEWLQWHKDFGLLNVEQPSVNTLTVKDLREVIAGMPDDAQLVVQFGIGIRWYHVEKLLKCRPTGFSGHELHIFMGEEFEY